MKLPLASRTILYYNWSMKTKTCTKCGIEKSLDGFYKMTSSSDGHFSECKVCNGLRRKAWYEQNKVAYLEKSKGYYRANKEKMNAQINASKKKNPEKQRARTKVGYRITIGKLPHPKTLLCADCNQPAHEYHHPNGYDEEHVYDVVALCRKCHGKRHSEAYWAGLLGHSA